MIRFSSPRSPYRFALCLAVGAATADADVETAFYWNNYLFAYKIKHMPDLDQGRGAMPGVLGLPFDGWKHCGPTSVLNSMIYCANHGFPTVWPGPGDYQDDLYAVATLNDLALGIEMGTDSDGTSGPGMFDGTRTWLDQSAPGQFTVSYYSTAGNYAPTMTDLAKTAIGGSLVTISYGRYYVTGQFMGFDVLDRDGGHIVTLSRALREGGDQLLGIRDPSDSGDSLFAQSNFGTREVEITDRTIAAALNPGQLRVMSGLDYDATNIKKGYIDRYVAVALEHGYSWQPTPIDFTTTLKTIKVATLLGGPDSTGEKLYTVDGTVLDAVISPDHTSILMVLNPKAGGLTELHELDLLDGTTTKIAIIPGARSACFSRHRSLYAAAPNLIFLVDLDEKKVEATVIPPAPCSAVTYDDKADQVVVLCSDAKKLLRWKEGLGGAPKIVDLPATLDMGGSATIAIDPTDGDVFFATEKSPALVSVTDDGTIQPCIKTWILQGAAFPTALDLDDSGHLFATAGGQLFELELDTGAWKPVPQSLYSGKTVGAGFRIARSRTNYDPATMSGPAWRDVDPNELSGLFDSNFIPDCDSAPSNLEYGAGKAGTIGVPNLAGLDLPTLGMPTSIKLSKGLSGAMPVLLLGLQAAALPFDGGTIHVAPSFVIPIPVPIDANGTLTIPGVLPGDASLCGVTIYLQMLFADPGAPGYYHTVLTNGLARTFGS
jgi:hypothetical protein